MANEPEVEVLDVGLTDLVTRVRRWEVEQDGRVTSREQSQQHPIPEVYMAALEPLVGDAQAKVTVGAELAHNKEFGCKAQAFVSVSVTCNNKEDDISAVHNIIQPLVRQLVNEDLMKMKEDRDAHMDQIALAQPGKVANPPRASVKPPVAQPAAAAKPGVQRPSFRR